MAQWRKVIVSGSNSELNNISSSGDFVMSKDGAKMKFGADNEVTLTHVHDDGLLLSDQSGIGTTKLSFGDTATFVQQQADGELGIDADVKVDITAPAVSMSNDVWVGGDIFAVGNITFQGDSGGDIRLGDAADDNLVVGADISSSLVPNNNNAFNLGSNTQRWNDLFLSGSINANGGPHDIDSDSTITIDSVDGTSIDAGAASNFSTSTGALTLSGAGGVNIAGSNQEIDITTTGAVDINSAGFDVDASGAVGIDSDSTVTVGGTTITATADGGTVTLDGSTGIELKENNTTIISIDDSRNIVVGNATNSETIRIGHATSEVTIGDNLNVSGNTIITGDLDVNGTLTTIDTTNLQVKDKFIQVASGSVSSTNGGLIVNTTADGSGSAFYYDGDVDRWSLTKAGDTGHSDLAVTPRQFVTTVSQSAVPPSATPGDFGNSDASRRGMIHIQTADDDATKSVEGDIWIYS